MRSGGLWKTKVQLKTKDKMKNESTELAQKPPFCKTDVSGSAFSTHDLKCGNILNYNTAEGEILPTVIDWQDLKWLTEDPKGFNLIHSPIALNKELLIQFGFVDEGSHLHFKLANNWCFEWFDNLLGFSLCKGRKGLSLGKVKYVHELQNLHYSFTGVMLSLN